MYFVYKLMYFVYNLTIEDACGGPSPHPIIFQQKQFILLNGIWNYLILFGREWSQNHSKTITKLSQNDPKPTPNLSQTDPKPIRNRSQTDPKTIPNQPQTDPKQKKCALGKCSKSGKCWGHLVKKVAKRIPKLDFVGICATVEKRTNNDVKS